MNDNLIRTFGWQAVRPTVWALGSLAIPLVLFCVPTYVVARHAEDTHVFLKNYRIPSFMDSEIEAHVNYATNSDEANDVIFLGGSTCEMGIDPVQFEKLTGLRAYNLGTDGHIGLRGHALLLELYLRHHPPPKCVVLAADATDFYYVIHRELDVELCERYFWAYGSEEQRARPSHAHPISDYCTEGARILFGRISGGTNHYRSVVKHYPGKSEYANMSHNDWLSAYAAGRGFLKFTKRQAELSAAASPVDDQFADGQRDVLNRLGERCQKLNIRLHIRLTPLSPGRAPQSTAAIAKGLGELANQWQSVSIGQPLVTVFVADDFYDGIHLIATGVERFTRQLSEDAVFQGLK